MFPDSRLTWLATGSITIAIVVLGLKVVAYFLTGSVALYSDALESIVNVAAAVVAFAAIKISQIPADDKHQYGHHKVEYFSAVFEGVLIVGAAFLIFREAWNSFSETHSFHADPTGLAINGVATIINGLWCMLLIREGRKLASPALIADGKHLLTDVFSSVGILLGVILAAVSGWKILDPILATIVGLSILWSGWRLVSTSLSGLLDEAPDDATIRRIYQIIATTADGAIEAHDLRTRKAGPKIFADFHLVVGKNMTVSDAHIICDRIERALKNELGDVTTLIHVEPEDKAKHIGIVIG